jgi:hypothetical protein
MSNQYNCWSIPPVKTINTYLQVIMKEKSPISSVIHRNENLIFNWWIPVFIFKIQGIFIFVLKQNHILRGKLFRINFCLKEI